MRRTSGWTRELCAIATVLTLALANGCANQVEVKAWDPAAFRDLRTMEFLTVGPSEGPHWSTVWLVVIDDHVYMRLGSKSAERMSRNTTNPFVGIRIGGHEYERVRTVDAAAMADRVAAAMREKYWNDFFVRYFPHPMTMQLEPEGATPTR
jgi:hypothetical protein